MKPAQKLAIAVIFAVSLTPLLLFSYLGMHSRPLSDDHCHIYSAKQLDFVEYLIYWRGRIDGSYSDYMARSLLSPLDTEVTKLFPSILIGVWILSTSALLAKGLKLLRVQRYRRVIALVLSMQLVTAICSGLYSETALYWYAASVKYSAPMISLTFYFLLLLHAARGPLGRRKKQLITLAGGLLCFISAGFAETLSIALFVSLSILLSALWARSRGVYFQRCFPILAASWFAVIASMLLMITAPGVAERMAKERNWTPELVSLTNEDLLIQTWNTMLDRIADPAVFAGFGLLLAAGVILGLHIAKPNRHKSCAQPPGARGFLFFGLAAQIVLLPLLWSHTSDETVWFGKYSTVYFAVIACNAILIGGLLLLLRKQNLYDAIFTRFCGVLPCIALLLICATVALTNQHRGIHWRAYIYLWLSCQSMLFVIAVLLSWHLPRLYRRGFYISLASLFVITSLSIAAIALTGQVVSGADIKRTFTFANHLIVWQGLAWGLFLGSSIKACCAQTRGRGLWLLRSSALLTMALLLFGIIGDQLALLPKFQQFARDYDQRHLSILSQRESGERRIKTAPLAFDLARYLNVSTVHANLCAAQYYELTDTELAMR